MAGERLDFDIFARLREDGFAKAAKAAEGASGEVVKLAERLDKLGAKSTTAHYHTWQWTICRSVHSPRIWIS